MSNRKYKSDKFCSKQSNDGKGEMRATILGSGSAVPDPIRGNPSQAVEIDGEIFLFDCGERTTVNLTRAGINPLNIDNIFLTHLHWDHIADLNYFLMTTWNCGKSDKLTIYGPPGTQEMTDNLLKAHQVDIDFVEAYIDSLPKHVTEHPSPELSLEVSNLKEGVLMENDFCKIIAKEIKHLDLLGKEFEHSSWAYRVESPYGSVAISGDTEPCEAMVELAKDVDLLIHEAAFLEEIVDEREMSGHSSPRSAGQVAQEAGAKKLVLTHLGPYDSYPAAVEMASMYYGSRRGPEVWSEVLRAAAEEYDGPIVLGEDGMSFEFGSEG